MHVANVVAAGIAAVLANRFDKRDDLHVTDGAANLNNGDIGTQCSKAADALLDFVGDVRNYLHRLAEVVTTALLSNHLGVDGARCRI